MMKNFNSNPTGPQASNTQATRTGYGVNNTTSKTSSRRPDDKKANSRPSKSVGKTNKPSKPKTDNIVENSEPQMEESEFVEADLQQSDETDYVTTSSKPNSLWTKVAVDPLPESRRQRTNQALKEIIELDTERNSYASKVNEILARPGVNPIAIKRWLKANCSNRGKLYDVLKEGEEYYKKVPIPLE